MTKVTIQIAIRTSRRVCIDALGATPFWRRTREGWHSKDRNFKPFRKRELFSNLV